MAERIECFKCQSHFEPTGEVLSGYPSETCGSCTKRAKSKRRSKKAAVERVRVARKQRLAEAAP